MSWRRWWSKLTEVTFHKSLGAGAPGSPLLPFCPGHPTQRQPDDLAFTITHIPTKRHFLLISSFFEFFMVRHTDRHHQNNACFASAALSSIRYLKATNQSYKLTNSTNIMHQSTFTFSVANGMHSIGVSNVTPTDKIPTNTTNY